jgi:hypothetical protein
VPPSPPGLKSRRKRVHRSAVEVVTAGWVCQNFFGIEPNVQSAYSIETFAWDQDGNLESQQDASAP